MFTPVMKFVKILHLCKRYKSLHFRKDREGWVLVSLLFFLCKEFQVRCYTKSPSSSQNSVFLVTTKFINETDKWPPLERLHFKKIVNSTKIFDGSSSDLSSPLHKKVCFFKSPSRPKSQPVKTSSPRLTGRRNGPRNNRDWNKVEEGGRPNIGI